MIFWSPFIHDMIPVMHNTKSICITGIFVPQKKVTWFSQGSDCVLVCHPTCLEILHLRWFLNDNKKFLFKGKIHTKCYFKVDISFNFITVIISYYYSSQDIFLRNIVIFPSVFSSIIRIIIIIILSIVSYDYHEFKL